MPRLSGHFLLCCVFALALRHWRAPGPLREILRGRKKFWSYTAIGLECKPISGQDI